MMHTTRVKSIGEQYTEAFGLAYLHDRKLLKSCMIHFLQHGACCMNLSAVAALQLCLHHFTSVGHDNLRMVR